MGGVVMVIPGGTPATGFFFHRSSECPSSARDEALDLVAGPLDQVRDLGPGLAPFAQHVGRNGLGIARRRAAHADPYALEVGRAEVAPQRAQSVVAAQPAAEARAHLAER